VPFGLLLHLTRGAGGAHARAVFCHLQLTSRRVGPSVHAGRRSCAARCTKQRTLCPAPGCAGSTPRRAPDHNTMRQPHTPRHTTRAPGA
jgi:hypothetical protein